MSTSTLRVHLAQMNSVDDVAHNVGQVISLLEQVPPAIAGQEQLVCFPENSLYLRLGETGTIPPLNLQEGFWAEFARIGAEKNAVLHFGSVPLKGREKLLNSSVLLRPGQSPTPSYTKIHLFDIDVEGHRPIRESESFEHGHESAVFEVNGWSIGQSICYDVRFSELYHRYARLNVDVILVPAAFLVPTGRAHWETLLRARAIESQAYVLAAAQAGRHVGHNGGERMTYGHSLIVEPWGGIVEDAGAEGVRLISAELKRTEIAKVRRQIPMKDHRRL